MKNWFIRFLLSNALDSGKPSSPSLEKAAARSEETRRFAESVQALDQSLRRSVPGETVPPGLSDSIMRAVRQRAPEPDRSSRRRLAPMTWAGATAAACALLVIAAIWGSQRLLLPPTPLPPSPGRLAAVPKPAEVMRLGDQMLRTVPAAATAPLQDEWENIYHDAAAARQTLVASLP